MRPSAIETGGSKTVDSAREPTTPRDKSEAASKMENSARMTGADATDRSPSPFAMRPKMAVTVLDGAGVARFEETMLRTSPEDVDTAGPNMAALSPDPSG